MGHEIHFTPEWTEDISHIQENSNNTKKIPFKLSQNIGYFTPDGKIVSAITFPFKSTISEKWYAAFGASGTKTDFFFADGTLAGTINEAGFPFFDQDRIFVMQPGGTAFVKCDSEGKCEWNYEHYSPITAFSSSKNGTAAGYADGTVISFLPDGKIDQKFAPGGSNCDVILGVAISENGNRIACVSGQDQQRFIVAEKNGGHSKVIFHEYLENSISRQTLVKFNNNSDYVYYNGKDFLGIVNTKKSTSKKIPIKGKISQIEFSDDNELVFVLSKDEEKYTVTILESFIYPMASFSFEGECSFIKTYENSIFIGRNTKISKISISKK
ncbi:MAG: hypothetical protein PUI64_04250 [Treponema succinifaciens]|nr:hypothetical protein [Treponema succinifaciens]MDD6962095.1 hypothetical protein [Treponema succinifaciens]